MLATYLALIALGTTFMAGYILWSFQGYFMKTRQDDLDSLSAALSESVADELDQNDLKQVELLVQRYGAAETITLRVFDAQSRLLATSSPEIDSQVQDWLVIPGMREALQGQTVQGVGKGILTNDDRLYIVRPIRGKDGFLGVLRMSITLERFQRQFGIVIWTVMGGLLLTIFLCTLISEWLARSISRPIQTMRNFAMRLGSGYFGSKLDIHQSDELDQLAVELNRMSERLASLDQERRAFLANVSHELRTPISNVQVTVEALKSGAYEEPDLRDRFFQAIEDETKRLARLVHDLLDLGRLEAGITSLELQTISLQRLIERAVRAMEPRMQSKEVSFHLSVSDIQLQADPERLLQAFLNVLDNAIKHSRPNSKVSIISRKDNNRAVITIKDEGEGIDESALPHIFEQFYTADPSRQGSGTGLGLAIARRIIEAHGGSITASSSKGKGATFILSLPLVPVLTDPSAPISTSQTQEL